MPGSIPLDTQPGLGIQPLQEAPGDLRVEVSKIQVIIIGGWDFPAITHQNVCSEAAKQKFKNFVLFRAICRMEKLLPKKQICGSDPLLF